MTTIALFGANGKTGKRVLTRALAAGHHVRALVRNPQAVEVTDERLTVLPGDVLDAEAVSRTVEGSDVVLSLFGQVKGSPKALQTDGTRNIVAAMKAHGVTRIVSLSGGGMRVAGKDKPKFADHVMKLLLKTMAGHVLADAENHAEVLKASGLDWTIVRGPRLLETPGTGSYRVGWVGVGTGMEISRDDLADFIMTQVEDRNFVHEMPFVSN